MKSKKHLPLALYSAALLSIVGLKPSSATAQTAAVTVSNTAEEQMYRPHFHFTPKKGWMNDPNGMFFANGYYHLFYQHYPDGNTWGPMHWGHAISKDLIKWEEQPIALYPDKDKYIFSGSAVVDTQNISGLGTGKAAPIVAIYTLHDMTKEKAGKIDVEQQDIAFSNDNGFTWQKFEEGNPVVKNPGIRDFRDPKVSWDETHKQWIMALAAQDRIHFYKSSNLKDWEFASEFGKNIGAHGGVWECPDFFEIKVEGTKETKWVLIVNLNPGGPNGGSGVQYFVGDFDGKTFTMDTTFAERVNNEKAVWADYGKDNYAGVTWNNVPTLDGRRLFIGWMSNWEYAQQVPTTTWRSSTTIPRELKLVKKENHYNLVSTPVKEINNYVSKTIKTKSKTGKGTLNLIESGKVDLTQTVVSLDLKNLKQEDYTFTLSNANGESLSFGLNNKENYLFIDRSKAGITDFSDKFALPVSKAFLEGSQKSAAFKIILDKTSIEIFYNNGEKVMTEIFFLNKPFSALTISSKQKIEIKNGIIQVLDINKKQ
ncbi:glycoside hydrolase family 32 protein [Flavobacterium sp. WLB]|uniref:Levanase n=1 Tax=Flavobacterium panici TaxID=2654843 RepID=A0A9N8P3H6_9FLAO|nr:MULTISPECIES: glycoside hydrolase family 32 protein [Flavobacterium]KOP38812.1 glycosyl hydrolase family 32 [Flavobacterium sp. VMW]OWU92752.1 glycosyl hydrolase family 32 [Flavobacterium sp. NLM]PUU71963.1 glycoside hydrolase family 32 protein [Flavobacterium sp. WLB]CAC9976098.1 Levanase [Flavobacterium panici]